MRGAQEEEGDASFLDSVEEWTGEIGAMWRAGRCADAAVAFWRMQHEAGIKPDAALYRLMFQVYSQVRRTSLPHPIVPLVPLPRRLWRTGTALMRGGVKPCTEGGTSLDLTCVQLVLWGWDWMEGSH